MLLQLRLKKLKKLMLRKSLTVSLRQQQPTSTIALQLVNLFAMVGIKESVKQAL